MIRELDTRYGKMLIPDSDDAQYPWLSVSKASPEDAHIERVCKLLDEGGGCDIALDVGASFGCWTLALAKHAKLVVAYEPQAHVYGLLNKTIDVNKLVNRVVVLPYAVLDQIGRAYMANIPLEQNYNFGGLALVDQTIDTFEVATTTVDLSVANFPGRTISFIKMDIEGSELRALEGAKETIRKHKPILFIEAFHGNSDPFKISEFVRGFGYTVDCVGPNFLCLPINLQKLGTTLDTPKDQLKTLIEAARLEYEQSHFEKAEALYRLVLRDSTPPDLPIKRIGRGEACLFFGKQALLQRKSCTAIDWFLEAVHADPLAIEYRLDLIRKMLLPIGMADEALGEAVKATRIEPNDPRTWRALGLVEHRLGHAEECIDAYERALALEPSAIAKLDRATIAIDTGDYDTVFSLLQPLLNSDLRGDVCHCLAMAYYRKSQFTMAIEYYDKAIDAGSVDPSMVQFNKSLACHSIGRYREGWAAHEYRGRQTTDQGVAIPMNRFVLPLWNHEPPPARLHLHREMGDGDTFALARFAPILAERGYDVRLEISDSMLDLMKRSFPNVSVFPKALDYPSALGIPPFDYHIPLLSFPHLFDLDTDNIPVNTPYIKAAEAKSATYRKIPSKGRRIGLCWSSGIRIHDFWTAEYGRNKSMHFDQLIQLLSWLHNDTFFSLQVGPERSQAKGILDVLPKKPTWDDTAALIDSLDLVVTVDTSVAHLAGAMNKPTYLMMHTQGSWHWMVNVPGASWNKKSPWYPSVRIYRQQTPNDWDPVIAKITSDLL